MLSDSLKKYEARWFFVLNISAGALNYLFLICAARRLETADYANFTRDSALYSVLCFLPLFLQMSANFFSKMRETKKNATIILVMSTVAFLSSIFFVSLSTLFMVGLFLSCIQGWLLGQFQNQKKFLIFGAAGLVVAMIKFTVLFGPATGLFFFEVFTLSSFAGVLILSGALILQQNTNVEGLVSANPISALVSAAVLSLITMLIPQYDLLFVSYTQPADVLASFGRIALLYRGVFFILLILAQWILPFQVRRQGTSLSSSRQVSALVSSLILGVVFMAFGPRFLAFMTTYEVNMPSYLFFLSCVQITLLTLLFLNIQKFAAELNLRVMLLAVGALVFFLLEMIWLRPTLKNYYELCILVEVILWIFLMLR